MEPSAIPSRRAFISAPLATDTGVIREALEQLGISAFSADDVDVAGVPMAEAVQQGIERADLVVALMSQSPPSSNVMFELGIAHALKKQTLVIAEAEVIPTVATLGLPYIRATLKNREAIAYALQQLAAAATSRQLAIPPRQETAGTGIGDAVNPLLDRLRRAEESHSEIQLVSIIADAVQAAGVAAIARETKDTGADLAVWSDDLQPWIPNPFVIEVKGVIANRGDASRTFDKLYVRMPALHAAWALLIYLDAPADAANALDRGPVLAISAKSFIESLRTTPFSKLVLALRHARVHGR
jgi:hypothetical protein